MTDFQESSLISRWLKAARSVLPDPGDSGLALHEPLFEGSEWTYVKDCLDSGWVSSVGRYVDLFEEKLAEFTGVARAVVVVNGTAALHICLVLAGVKPGDEVLTPDLCFVATANAITYCGAVPHFTDSEERSLGMDAAKLRDHLREIAEVRGGVAYNRRTGRPIRALVPMHTFGHPVDLDALAALAEEFSLVLIEDAAESLGSYYHGRHTGNIGRLAALSFNGNKIVTTGGGGAILTNDPELGRLAKHLTTTAKQPHAWEFFHDQVGYNYRLPNINAALGCAQLEQLPRFLERKRALALAYQTALAGIPGAAMVPEPPGTRSNYWLNALLLAPENADLRDEVLRRSREEGLMTRPVWNLMHTLPMYADCPRMDCSTAESLAARLINLPSGVRLYGA